MAIVKGKKRAHEELETADLSRASSFSLCSLSPAPEQASGDRKKAKRAETKKCPVCAELIPVRLLSAHAELEAERVEAIVNRVGDVDVLDLSVVREGGFFEDPVVLQLRPRLRARKSTSTCSPVAPPSDYSSPGASSSTFVTLNQTLAMIKRHRKQRFSKLKELAREEEGLKPRNTWSRQGDATGIRCPVCEEHVTGDADVLEAHVDACLAIGRIAEEQQREMERRVQMREEEEEEEDISTQEGDSVVGHVGDVRGTGILTRPPHTQSDDIDDEIDIFGDDEAVYGDAQFTEGDIVTVSRPASSEDNNLVGEEERTLRELVAEGKVIRRRKEEEDPKVSGKLESLDEGEEDRLDLAILAARQRQDTTLLISLLENKLDFLQSHTATASLCRICISPYTDPTVSTGCWHTCCKDCWLRCLGSTKLCPICKRITGAGDLRRVFL